jgi:hypothetical protein
VVLGGLVISRRDASESLQSAIGVVQDNSFDALLFEEGADHIGIIAFISNQVV